MSVQPEAEPKVLVIGAGPAGLSAAVTAADLGLRVLLVDESAAAGGQYLSHRDGSQSDGTAAMGDAVHRAGDHFQTGAEREGSALIARMHGLSDAVAARLELKWGTTVWSLNANLTAMLYSRGSSGAEVPLRADQRDQGAPLGSERVQADAVILATGARETVAPFPGWTLPGVMTVGAAQLLAKRHDVNPSTSGQRVLLAGSGLLLLPAAARLVDLGAKVVGVLEVERLGASWIRQIGALRGVAEWAPALWERRGEGWHYLGTLRKHRIPYLFGRAVVRAAGEGHVETVDIARLDRTGAPVPGLTETWPVDLLCVGYGLVPNVELAQLAGARVIYDPALGGWAVDVDAHSRVQTSLPGLFVAGETAGISGASAALLSGRLAAMSAATRLGRLSEAALQSEMIRTTRLRRQHERFGALVNLLFRAPDGLYRAIPDDTPLCRCEEVTAGQVRAAIDAGALTLDALKPALRVGQGLCQGRTCGPTLARMLAVQTGRSVEEAGLFQARPPVKPVPLAALSNGTLAHNEPQCGGVPNSQVYRTASPGDGSR